jgi:hypothetical protein
MGPGAKTRRIGRAPTTSPVPDAGVVLVEVGERRARDGDGGREALLAAHAALLAQRFRRLQLRSSKLEGTLPIAD